MSSLRFRQFISYNQKFLVIFKIDSKAIGLWIKIKPLIHEKFRAPLTPFKPISGRVDRASATERKI